MNALQQCGLHWVRTEIVAKLRQVDVLVLQGKHMADAIRSIGVTEVSCHRWRRGHPPTNIQPDL
ncbi:hypothetical protein [Bosea sp. 685]|uniref:hypothetical protein n=1 Tax=Bosea sp. 685 TaxID=3080057 RepID=UPI0028930E13|nr:hypothetical protein [Bosea sp. 685]WNJ94133.1 hypothetical protein RMR04_27245 [Bosea sp. 685]